MVGRNLKVENTSTRTRNFFFFFFFFFSVACYGQHCAQIRSSLFNVLQYLMQSIFYVVVFSNGFEVEIHPEVLPSIRLI